MSSEVELEARPRPLSGGLWTLFSWLRRDERGASSDSLSSSGSDRTVASFAFLSPARYNAAAPLVLPPPPPPTDSYKKRVHDRNVRRQHDRDLTLHRKYGLYKSEGPYNYDAFSLPPPTRKIQSDSENRWDRDRRATSESLQRRLAHVPGKRRAPLPPTAPGVTTSLTRRSRKRRAPLPPTKIVVSTKENIRTVVVKNQVEQMGSNEYRGNPTLNNNDITMECKPEKYSKKEANSKETKLRSEKSFLKQIFDSRKRSSMIDTASVKVLPSISELDKQAAEIIENSKALAHNNNIPKTSGLNIESRRSNQGDYWFCVSCLRKYNSSVISCLHCVSNKSRQVPDPTNNVGVETNKAFNSCTQTDKVTSTTGLRDKNVDSEEKQKLKEMLKEMKDSLPKRPKHDLSNKLENSTVVTSKVSDKSPYTIETPTLRVGSTGKSAKETYLESRPSSSQYILKNQQITSQNLVAPSTSTGKIILYNLSKDDVAKNKNSVLEVQNANTPSEPKKVEIKIQTEVLDKTEDNKALHTPLRISSLLNPVYIPKASIAAEKALPVKVSQSETKSIENQKTPTVTQTPAAVGGAPHVSPAQPTSQTRIVPVKTENKPESNLQKSSIGNLMASKKVDKLITSNEPKKYNKAITSSSTTQTNNIPKCTDAQDQHTKRRDLINQLEQSIAKGDERSAAEAAVKLAQLRLSCSVLSFTSQILSQPSTSFTQNKQITIDNEKKEPLKVLPPKTLNLEPNIIKSETVTSNVVKENSSVPDLNVSKGLSSVAVTKNKTVSTPSTSNVATSNLQCLPKTKEARLKQKNGITNTELQKENTNLISIAVLVEDREATRGPVQLRIRRTALLRDLRKEAEASLGLASHLQRWIIGRVLCSDDTTPVVSLAGLNFTAPFYLCVVESETKFEKAPPKDLNKIDSKETKDTKNQGGNVYTELVQLEQQALVPNTENFECGVCIEEYPPNGGVVLRDCVHVFCKDCLSDVVRHCEEPDIPCPAMGCKGMLQEREIRALVSPQDYERWLARGLAAAESGTRNSFHCRTKDCKGWALCEPGVQKFPCPVCKRINCVPCQAIHDGETCDQYRAKLKQKSEASTSTAETDDGTKTLLAALISKGEALECPECSAIITKKWGCDWVKCSACKTEICWVTRGRRWGPAGKGDTSAGCRCGVDGKRCHPSCGYCH